VVFAVVGTGAAGFAVDVAVTGAGVAGGGGDIPRLLHSAGISEQVTYTMPGHSRSSTESLPQVKESRRGKSAGQDGGVLSTYEASYSLMFISVLVSTAPYFADNVSN